MAFGRLVSENCAFEEAETPILRVSAWSAATRTLAITGFNRDQLFTFGHTTNADRSISESEHVMSDFPMMVQVRDISAASSAFKAFVRVELVLAGARLATLMQGYVGLDNYLNWPNGTIQGPQQGRGYVHLVTGTDPAANTEVSEAVPANAIWKILAIYLKLTTDANVADRTIKLIISDGTDDFMELDVSGTITASLTRQTTIGPGMYTDLSGTYQSACLPVPTILPEGYTIKTETINLQATDNYAAPLMLVEEWIQE